MKKLVLIAGIAALAACSKGEAPAPQETPAATEAAATTPGAGTFDYASEDGKVSGHIIMNEDGTFADNQNGTETTGTWRAGDGQTCFTDSAEGSKEVCWTDSEVAEDGSFTSTSPDGVAVKVTPVKEDKAADAG